MCESDLKGDPLVEAYEKLAHAERLAELAHNAFSDWSKRFRDWSATDIRIEGEGEFKKSYVRFSEKPIEACLFYDDAFQNIRNVLDYYAYCANQYFDLGIEEKIVYFPIYEARPGPCVEEGWNNSRFSKCLRENNYQEYKFVRALEPWQGGKLKLYELNCLVNNAKHRQATKASIGVMTPALVLDPQNEIYLRDPSPDPGGLNLKLSEENVFHHNHGEATLDIVVQYSILGGLMFSDVLLRECGKPSEFFEKLIGTVRDFLNKSTLNSV